MLDSISYVQNLRPTSRDIYGSKRSLTGYNVYLRYFFANFKSLTDEEKKEMLCDMEIHSIDMYLLSEEDSVVSVPKASTVEIINAAAKKWRKMGLGVKNAWKQLAMDINMLPILGVFNEIPPIVTNKEIKESMSQDHYKLVSTISNMLRNTKMSIQDTTLKKKFGKESVEMGNKVYKSFYLSYLLKLSFFGYNYECLHNRNEVIEKKKKSVIVHIRSMERIVNLFYKNGISAFSVLDQDKDLLYSCAGKVILLHTSSNKEEIGYIIKEGEILTESGRIVDMDGIYLPEFIREDGVWLNHCNDDSNTTYMVVEFHPIRLKLCDSGNCQILTSRVCLSNDKSHLILSSK